jgi:IclR family transcriptional regulator, KDG regulon repressor
MESHGAAQPVDHGAPAADMAARILKLLTRYRTSKGTLTEISTELEVPKASCLRVLRTLQAHALLAYDPLTRQYSLGTYALILGARAEESLDYMAELRVLLREASERTDLTAVLVQRVDAERMMYVAKQESSARHRVSVSVGNRFPITEVSYGKWIVAHSSAEERRTLLEGGLRQVTPATTTDVDVYLKQVEQLHRDGVLVSNSEYIRGITAVSSPAFDAHGRLLGVLAVLGMTPMLDPQAVAEIATVMRELGDRTRAGTQVDLGG